MNIWTILAIYWVVCCLAVYIIRNRDTFYNKKKLKFQEHITMILIIPLAVPFLLLYFMYKGWQQFYYKDRPRPVPIFLREEEGRDRVIVINEETMSLVEYNEQYGTQYTLDDIYGKGYSASLKKDKDDVNTVESTKYGMLVFPDNIPDTPCTDAVKLLARTLLSGNFNNFESRLDTDVSCIIYGKETISGKSAVIEYWKQWRKYNVEIHGRNFDVAYCNYYADACLLTPHNAFMLLVKDNKIKKILLVDIDLHSNIGYEYETTTFRYDINSIQPCLSEMIKSTDISKPAVLENRFPCFSCGTNSENLKWYNAQFARVFSAYSGYMSVCPHCNKVVEFYPEAQIRYTFLLTPKVPFNLPNPISHYSQKVSYEPELFGLKNFEGGEPLKGTKYVEGLPDNLKKAAENSDWFLLSTMSSEDFNKVRECYLKAIDDGIYEAANILGVFAENYEGDSEKGKMFLQKAIEGGSHYARLNLFTILWTEKKYEEAANLLNDADKMPSPSLKCLWNKAYLLFMGNNFAHNPYKEKNKAAAQNILKTILDKEGDDFYNTEKVVFDMARKLLAYIDESNIFASKAKAYRYRLKSKLNTINDFDAEAIFYDLDALSLDNGCFIQLKTARQYGKGSQSKFYVYDYHKTVEGDKDILKYITVSPTEMGAWQVYLLINSPTQLPTWGHGNYIVRNLIMDKNDLYNIGVLKYYELSELAQKEMLYPSVDVVKKGDLLTANIYCCYWNDWKGLIREHVEIKIKNGKVTSFQKIDDFVIFAFHCGIYI